MSDGTPTAVFAYGSLVSRASAVATLGPLDDFRPATLEGWRRGFTQARHNPSCEKVFAVAGSGELPEWILSLGVDPDPGSAVNGVLIGLDDARAARLDGRELRYERRDVTDAIAVAGEAPAGRVYTYVARPANRAPEPPAGAVILASYARATEEAFGELGEGELERFLATTTIPDVPVVEGTLVGDAVPPGNPREW